MNLSLDSRQHHLLVKALCLAVEAIDAAEPDMQPVSDRQDMTDLLDQLVGQNGILGQYQKDARRIVVSHARRAAA